MSNTGIYSASDRQIWEEELESFVPNKVFDAHIHLFHMSHMRPNTPAAAFFRPTSDLSLLREWAEKLYSGRNTRFLFLGTPAPGIDVDAHNPWCIAEAAGDLDSRLNVLVTSQCKTEAIRECVGHDHVVGLKPYRLFSVTGDVAQCRIHEFLPHEQMELANELGLWVTLHLSRYDGCADSLNLKDLEEYTNKRYPRIRWILAHCARSFTYWPIRHAIDRLRDMPNIWYDLSAVTDVRPFITLFQKENHQRLFYGSDGVNATYWPGQYTAFGRAWQAVHTDAIGLKFPHCDGRPILVIYEQLLAMKHAAEIVELSPDSIEDIFWRNAANAFGMRFS